MAFVSHFTSQTLPLKFKYQLLAAVRIEWYWVFTGENQLWDYTHKNTCPGYITITDTDVLISFAEVNVRMLRHADEDYLVAGLSAVYTFPAYRNQGFGQQVVQAATHTIQTSTADFGLLFCLPAYTGWYEAYGWHILPAPILVGDPNMPTPHHGEMAMVQILSEKASKNQAPLLSQSLYVGAYTW